MKPAASLRAESPLWQLRRGHFSKDHLMPLRSFSSFSGHRHLTPHTLLRPFLSKLLSSKLLLSVSRPGEGLWLTHWVLSNRFDPLLWLWPSVSCWRCNERKTPAGLSSNPQSQALCFVHDALDNSNLVSESPWPHGPVFCSCLHNLPDDENQIKG